MHETIVHNSQLLPGLICGADESIALRGAKVDFMIRDLPRDENDSGWCFQDTEEYSHLPSNPHAAHPLDSILALNSDVLPFLNAPYFTAFTRCKNGKLIRNLEIEQDYDEERKEYQEGLKLIPVIAEAFRDVKLEEGTSFHQSIALDNYEDTKAARLLDTDKHWSEVDMAKVREHGFIGGMSFMDTKGFRYYLPAYMTFELRYPRFGNNFGLEFHLTKKGEDQFADRFKALNHAQSVVVRRFLEYKLRYHSSDYKAVLQSYWYQFKD